MEEPSVIERLAGSGLAKGGLTLVAAMSGLPIAALLPVLGESLAGNRHRQRVENELRRINEELKAYQDKIDNLTDDQYKLINEALVAVLQNTESAKADMLRNAVLSGLDMSDLSATESAQASRAIRDLSAGELAFLVKHAGRTMTLGTASDVDDQGVVHISKSCDDMVYFSGLLGLGLIVPAGSTIGSIGNYVFAPICSKVRDLIVREG